MVLNTVLPSRGDGAHSVVCATTSTFASWENWVVRSPLTGLATRVGSLLLAVVLCYRGHHLRCDAAFVAVASPVAQSACRALVVEHHRFEAVRQADIRVRTSVLQKFWRCFINAPCSPRRWGMGRLDDPPNTHPDKSSC